MNYKDTALFSFKEDIYTCNRSRCAFCREGCPSYKNFNFESYSPRGRISIACSILEGKLHFSKKVAENMFTCTMCRYCNQRCGTDDTLIIKTMKIELIERGITPPEVKNFLENIQKYGNPWGASRKKRGEIIDNGIKPYEHGTEFLYHVGCVGSYHERAQNAARSLGEVLSKAGLSFGALGDKENCCGNEVNTIGEEGLFQLMVKENIKQLNDLGVTKIVTLCPHCYNTIKNEYPQHGGKFEAIHYTQLLRDLLKSGKISISEKLNVKVAYHDPCFLGRYNKEFDAPREILQRIPGIKLLEMEREKQYSFCCGGGGGNFYTGYLEKPARQRVREACEAGAEILAVSCPICLIMLDDAIRTEDLEGKLFIKDISEILNEVNGSRNH